MSTENNNLNGLKRQDRKLNDRLDDIEKRLEKTKDCFKKLHSYAREQKILNDKILKVLEDLKYI
jgi:hypothetical protein